jgi:hypothetical protein
MNGIKYDNDKLRWLLLAFKVLEDVVKVLMYGLKRRKREMIIAIDMDGTITTDGTGKKEMILQHLAKEVIQELAKEHTLILYTCREGKKLDEAKEFLRKHEMLDYFKYFNSNANLNILKYGNDCRKIGADIYIDDRILGGFIGWSDVFKHIVERGIL